ncbi:MAG: TIGR00730 family Rossman fold protein [Bacteroidaceae bacterium]|nr:TIGR00730 family Rossman fold protein [Bacteroidaceae bacterium]
MKNIGLFCAASETIESIYVDAARELGTLLGKGGHTLVYGGAAKGLMETTAKAAKSSGARIVGVVPNLLVERGCVSTLLDEQITVANLSQRKDAILERSDLLIAMPGGIGTLDEVFHVMAAATIGYHKKKVVFYNVNNFWDSMATLLADYKAKGFLRGELDHYCCFAGNYDELKEIIEREI